VASRRAGSVATVGGGGSETPVAAIGACATGGAASGALVGGGAGRDTAGRGLGTTGGAAGLRASLRSPGPAEAGGRGCAADGVGCGGAVRRVVEGWVWGRGSVGADRAGAGSAGAGGAEAAALAGGTGCGDGSVAVDGGGAASESMLDRRAGSSPLTERLSRFTCACAACAGSLATSASARAGAARGVVALAVGGAAAEALTEGAAARRPGFSADRARLISPGRGWGAEGGAAGERTAAAGSGAAGRAGARWSRGR